LWAAGGAGASGVALGLGSTKGHGLLVASRCLAGGLPGPPSPRGEHHGGRGPPEAPGGGAAGVDAGVGAFEFLRFGLRVAGTGYARASPPRPRSRSDA
jgi:hypothetical protein